MMALELPDTKGANLSRSRFRQPAVTETSVHNAVRPVTRAPRDVFR
jgi:hypothetical protein